MYQTLAAGVCNLCVQNLASTLLTVYWQYVEYCILANRYRAKSYKNLGHILKWVVGCETAGRTKPSIIYTMLNMSYFGQKPYLGKASAMLNQSILI